MKPNEQMTSKEKAIEALKDLDNMFMAVMAERINGKDIYDGATVERLINHAKVFIRAFTGNPILPNNIDVLLAYERCVAILIQDDSDVVMVRNYLSKPTLDDAIKCVETEQQKWEDLANNKYTNNSKERFACGQVISACTSILIAIKGLKGE